ncbi:hypothetical protein [Eubacterium sp.]|nr:hypothetical protein [Eubacterium sp.]MCR5629540.1 hypothetical protein [Eubacterium sp.]
MIYMYDIKIELETECYTWKESKYGTLWERNVPYLCDFKLHNICKKYG